MKEEANFTEWMGYVDRDPKACDLWDEYFDLDVNDPQQRELKVLVASTAVATSLALKELKISDLTRESLDKIENALLSDEFGNKEDFLDFIRSLKGRRELFKRYASLFHEICLWGTNRRERLGKGELLNGKQTPYGRIVEEYGYRWRGSDGVRTEMQTKWENYRAQRAITDEAG